MRMIVLKTRGEHLDVVVRSGKHATDALPRDVALGDIVLLAQTREGLAYNQKSIEYAALYGGWYEDEDGETDGLWGRHWRYIIKLDNIVRLETPFALPEVQVSAKNYGKGVIRYAKVDKADAEKIVSIG